MTTISTLLKSFFTNYYDKNLCDIIAKIREFFRENLLKCGKFFKGASMKDKVIGDLNALFKARGDFYAFFDAKIPKVGQTAVFDFEALKKSNLPCGEALKGSENSAFETLKKGENSACGVDETLKNSTLGTADDESIDLECIYRLFYHYDYAIRKLLPSLYKAYKIDSERDLSKDF